MDKIKVNFQYLKYLNFNVSDAPKIFFIKQETPEIGIAVKVEAQKYENSIYEVVLKINITANIGQIKQYELQIHYAVLCEVLDESDSDGSSDVPLEKYLMVDVPAFIFPSARSIIANTTREANLPSLLLTPIDFMETYKRNKKQNDEQS